MCVVCVWPLSSVNVVCGIWHGMAICTLCVGIYDVWLLCGLHVVYMFLHVWFTYSVCVVPECCLWGAGWVSDTDLDQCCFSSLNFSQRMNFIFTSLLIDLEEKFSKWLGGQKQSLSFEKCLIVGKVFSWPVYVPEKKYHRTSKSETRWNPAPSSVQHWAQAWGFDLWLSSYQQSHQYQWCQEKTWGRGRCFFLNFTVIPTPPKTPQGHAALKLPLWHKGLIDTSPWRRPRMLSVHSLSRNICTYNSQVTI